MAISIGLFLQIGMVKMAQDPFQARYVSLTLLVSMSGLQSKTILFGDSTSIQSCLTINPHEKFNTFPFLLLLFILISNMQLLYVLRNFKFKH